MRADALNWHDYGGYTEMTAPSLNICYTDGAELKRITMHKTLSQSCSANRDESNKAPSTEIYRRTITQTWTHYVLQRKKNHNAPLRNKKTQIMRLYMMCLTILTSLTNFNAEETTLTCHTKERTWPLQDMNTLQIFWTIQTNIIIVTAKYCPVKLSKKLFSKSRKREKKK